MKVPMARASWPVELPRTDVSTTKGTKDTEEGPCRAARVGLRRPGRRPLEPGPAMRGATGASPSPKKTGLAPAAPRIAVRAPALPGRRRSPLTQTPTTRLCDLCVLCGWLSWTAQASGHQPGSVWSHTEVWCAPGLAGARQAVASGSLTVTVVPRPSPLSTSIVKPQRSTTALTMASPRPVPCGSIAFALVARKNSSNR